MGKRALIIRLHGISQKVKRNLFKDNCQCAWPCGRAHFLLSLNVKKTIKEACAYDFVKKLPDFLDYEIEEGGKNLSGGQRQRLSIARALIKNSELLILDDSTSALDYLTEKELKTNIFNKKDLTILIIAQRVSSLLNCDKIIVMYHGEVENIGTHEELLKKSKVYKEIYDSQYGDRYETN